MARIELQGDFTPEGLARLQKLAQEQKWKVGRVKKSSKETQNALLVEWEKQITKGREMLALVQNPSDEAILRLQTRNAFALLDDVFSLISHPQVPFLQRIKNSGVDWDEARRILFEILASYFPDEPPSGTVLEYSSRGKPVIGNRHRHNTSINLRENGLPFALPEETIITLDGYGITDGVRKLPKQLGVIYSMYPNTAEAKMTNAMRALQVNPVLRRAILEFP